MYKEEYLMRTSCNLCSRLRCKEYDSGVMPLDTFLLQLLRLNQLISRANPCAIWAPVKVTQDLHIIQLFLLVYCPVDEKQLMAMPFVFCLLTSPSLTFRWIKVQKAQWTSYSTWSGLVNDSAAIKVTYYTAPSGLSWVWSWTTHIYSRLSILFAYNQTCIIAIR